MKNFSVAIFLFLLLLGCHKETQEEFLPLVASDQQENMNHKQKLDTYYGEILLSFEEFEFIYKNNSYYIIDKNQKLSNYINKHRADKQKFHIKGNMCLVGELINKSYNKGHGFGHLEKYQQAIIVHDFC